MSCLEVGKSSSVAMARSLSAVCVNIVFVS